MHAENKRAFFDYNILEKWEAGIELAGDEVKSIRDGQISLKESYVTIKNSELFLINANISAYKKSRDIKGYNPTQSRRLLLKKKEIDRIIGLKTTQGLTIVPLKVYTKHHWIKLEIGLGKGKKKFEKKEQIKKKDIERELKRGEF
ncbi:MAG: SsrA-binding protein [Candidatus Magasanikbacteria bacterium GW2011_GWC2_40_17]|uniref:SsrA-binding protein n=1 Tax=Candidatus Magasanikbacteria bacterium GW2011_GWA2_42_32 TaxID=1619039 RepID=A0A0G1D4A8_9BACT|nr:MAG: SsrA-binding protein [Candidatus Magasanikbacteria bacterium GW2011_GWC2_40_17]KKS56863.1 MAG: SsrA-binding protein [Candidatus Magasanikbacteria bacterium GW2011_GWA2_42_32]